MPKWTASLLILIALAIASSLPAAAPRSQAAGLDSSLPSVTSGARPGPDVLYSPAPAAPQLENRDSRFKAPPLLVSGAEAYVSGEYLYQDFLYDDYGSDTDGNGGTPLSPRRGNIDYPTNSSRYGGNAADIVEFRIAAGPDSVAYRVTLNTLLAPDTTIVAIAFDTDHNALTGAATLPRDPGAPFPGTDEAITVWGSGAEHTRFSPLPVTTPLSVSTDLQANQITVTVPRTVSNPSGAWRTTVAAGLYDGATGGWLRPGISATATTPGGAGPLDPAPSGIFNLAFRFDEPIFHSDTPPDTNQALVLQQKNPTAYAHDIDFNALNAGASRDLVPHTGTQVRLFPSRLPLGEGRDLSKFPAYLGQLQPYTLYVPTTYSPGSPAGLTLNLHSLNEHYWQYNGSKGVQQMGEQRGNLVATSLSRGPDGWYKDVGEYDVFEMWNDVASHFSLDPNKVAISGYSMGGYATYRLGTLYPDLFGKAFTQVGPPGEGIWVPPLPPTGAPRGDQQAGNDGAPETLTNSVLENTRNLPYLNLAATEDELVPVAGTRAQNLGAPEYGIKGFDQLGYRFDFRLYDPSDHLALAATGYDFAFAPAFLGDASVDRNPPHVTFSYMPAADDASLGLVHDHAYWVSGLSPATITPFPAKGTIDAFSHAFGTGDPASAFSTGAGVQPLPYTEFIRTWGTPPAISRENRLDVSLTNLAQTTVDLPRARLDVCSTLTVAASSDGNSNLLLSGPFMKVTVTGAAWQRTTQGVVLQLLPGQTTATVAGDCTQPDLAVSGISFAAGTGPRSGKIMITATVSNLGNGAAPASQTQFRVDGALLATAGTPAIAAGASANVTVAWDTRAAQGVHTVTATADSAGAVAESNEANNARTVTVTVKGSRIK